MKKKNLSKKNINYIKYMKINFTNRKLSKNKTLRQNKSIYSWNSLEENRCDYVNKNSLKNPVKKLKKIALEDAIVWPTQTKDEVFRPILWYDILAGKSLDKTDYLLDITGNRLIEMNKNNVAYQIISATTSGIQNLKSKSQIAQINKAIEVNNYMHSKIGGYPDRFKAFAVLPMGSPKAAALELERSIKKLAVFL